MTDDDKRSLAYYKAEIKAELQRLEAQSTAKDVADERGVLGEQGQMVRTWIF